MFETLIDKVGNKEVKKKGKIRVGNWNIGKLTGEGRELVDVMQKRNIKILCIPGIEWIANSAKIIGECYKVYYSGDNRLRNGVGIILHPELQENVTEVVLINDRLMGLKLLKNGKT